MQPYYAQYRSFKQLVQRQLYESSSSKGYQGGFSRKHISRQDNSAQEASVGALSSSHTDEDEEIQRKRKAAIAEIANTRKSARIYAQQNTAYITMARSSSPESPSHKCIGCNNTIVSKIGCQNSECTFYRKKRHLEDSYSHLKFNDLDDDDDDEEHTTNNPTIWTTTSAEESLNTSLNTNTQNIEPDIPPRTYTAATNSPHADK